MKTSLSLTLLASALLFTSPTTYAVQLSVINTAESSGAIEGMVVEGGSWLKVRHLRQQVVVIKHPRGIWLLDAGVGRRTGKAFEQNSSLNRMLFGYRNASPAVDQLQAGGIEPSQVQGIMITHLHWDHAGGLPDFPGVPVWVQSAELDAANKGSAPSYLGEQRDAKIKWHTYEMPVQPYEGFERSLDLLGDGQLILVDLPGHTPGHTGLFVNASNGKRYFFSGDTTWTQMGIEQQTSRPQFTRWLTGVDWKWEANATTISKVAALAQRDPDLIILPAHDESMATALPAFPKFTEE